MLLQLMFVVVVVIIAAAAMVVAASGQLAKPDCQETCGNISIPYPFGTTAGCYHDEHFLITCNTTFSPPKPFLTKSNIQVTNISLDGQLNILHYVARDCYDQSGAQTKHNRPWIRLSKFRISSTRNMFTAVGCDTTATVYGYQGDKKYASGCISICGSIDYVSNGSCSGIGCCQTQIPKGVRYYKVELSSYHNHTEVWNFSPCSYAFVVQKNTFNFSSADLGNLKNVTMLPVVLDWAIENVTCKVAEKNLTTYACQNNSKCNDIDNGSGYLCSCLEGYQGSPYLPTGCQDIDECKDPGSNQCVKVCTNTPGNYTCSCPKGYHGDGRKDGQGCVADQLLVIKIVLSTVIGITVFLVGFSSLFLGLKKRKLIRMKEKFFQQNGGSMLQQLSLPDGSTETAKIFTAEELEKATDNYANDRIIGRGGYGTVYKGLLADNRTVAIKKSKIVDQSQIEQFINEVIVLSQINHRNVVKLLGCCLETEVPLLVYEFIPNGTLYDHIHNKSKASYVSWEVRLRIAAETAGVLSYLHSAASTPIIHRDVKSTNILLDDNYVAKVSDFGASRLVPLDEMQLSTMVQGTLGYLDPEYLHTSQLTEKSDVYSFGVVLVELLTGEKVLSFDRPEEERNLAMYFLASLKEDRLFQILEDFIVEQGNTEQLKEVANLAKRCLRVKGEERPSMKEVAMELEGLRMVVKHSWVDDDSEETEHLLGVSLEICGFKGSGSGETSVGYDSIREQYTVLPQDGGR